MSENFYTSSTAALKATKADIRNLNAKQIKLNGKPIPSKVLDERGDFVTNKDLWGTNITSDENGVVHVSHKFLSNPNIPDAWNSSVNSVKDNKAYTSTDASGEPLCNIQTEMIKDGNHMFDSASITSFDSDLSNLVDGYRMFYNSSLASFNGDLRSLASGDGMFGGCELKEFTIAETLHSLNLASYMFASTGRDRNSKLSVFSCPTPSLTVAEGMFLDSSLTVFVGDLHNLKIGKRMFSGSPIYVFIHGDDLGNLVNGAEMFHETALTSFSGNLSSLTDGNHMFSYTSLTSFDNDLSSLVDGSYMFNQTALESFSGDLNSLVHGTHMFSYTSLTSFDNDLSNLVVGSYMFYNTHKRGYTISHHKMMDNGEKMLVEGKWIIINGDVVDTIEHFRSEGLTSFNGDLSSLQTGYYMFGDGSNVTYKNEEGVTETTKNITPLDEQSVMIIADTIKDLNGFTDWDSSIRSSQRGIIHIGYDSTVCDAATIEEYCTEIMNKGWTVYLNGTVQTTDEGIEGLVTADEDGTITVTPVPYYCKHVEVEQKEANWTDGEKYYIILGAQKVFGDDLSTYGMFTSIEDAAMNMGFTPYEYVEEETIEEN